MMCCRGEERISGHAGRFAEAKVDSVSDSYFASIPGVKVSVPLCTTYNEIWTILTKEDTCLGTYWF
jgi:hypothetical protein